MQVVRDTKVNIPYGSNGTPYGLKFKKQNKLSECIRTYLTIYNIRLSHYICIFTLLSYLIVFPHVCLILLSVNVFAGFKINLPLKKNKKNVKF